MSKFVGNLWSNIKNGLFDARSFRFKKESFWSQESSPWCGTLPKKLGIWHLAKNLQNKLWFYTPDHSRSLPIEKYQEKSGEIGSWLFPIIPIIPDCQLTFPIIPDALGLVQNYRPAHLACEAFPAAGAFTALAGFAFSRPCIANDNSKGEHCYYIS
jgi:hypothetical protein